MVLGGGLGWLFVRWMFRLFRRSNRALVQRVFGKLQILGGVANAFLHGAQDGQKFIGVLLLSVSAADTMQVSIPLWAVFLCSGVLSFGTCLGGGRIIRTVGMRMVRMEGSQGVAADLASAVSLGFCTAFGLPVSTTHVKTTAVMGAGAAVRLRSVNWSIAGRMVLAWGLTFPGCGLLGYGMAKMFLALFF